MSNLKTVIASQVRTDYKYNNVKTKIRILHVSLPIWVKFGVESLRTMLLINCALGENKCLESQALRSVIKKILNVFSELFVHLVWDLAGNIWTAI